MDTAWFSSACHYRYATLGLSLLRANLADEPLVAQTVRAFLEAQIAAMPGGKQAGFAAHNPPSYVLVVLHDGQPHSLSNAFARPVRQNAHGEDLVGESILAIERYLARVTLMHGARPEQRAIACADRDVTREAEGITLVPTLASLVDGVMGFAVMDLVGAGGTAAAGGKGRRA
jgi:CRISPR system Cascade subunit CasC